MSQDYYGRNSRFPSSWNIVNNELYEDDDPRYYASYATDWSLLNSQDVNEGQLSSLPQNNYNGGYGFNNYGSSTIRQQQERNPSPPLPEPEFRPSISASTKDFIENTFRFERRREEDIVGRPDEYDDDCCPPPQLSDSDIQSSFLSDDSQFIVSGVKPSSSSSSSSWSIAWYSLFIVIIGVTIYYAMDLQFVELNNIF